MSKTPMYPLAHQELDNPGETGLKAERIQLTAPDGETRLKAERIQLALRDLPGWRITRQARFISRTVEVSDPQHLARLVQSVADAAGKARRMPDLEVQRGRVTLNLPVVGGSWLEEETFELAKALGESA